jgi:hypothetical protein
MNYILVADGTDKGTSSALAEVSFQIREGDATILASYDVPNVPVQRNFRSNIVGGLLTAEGTINVIIDPIFNGEYVINVWDGYTVEAPAANTEATEYYVTKASELAWVAQQVNEAGNTFEGVTVYLTSDIDLAGQVWTPIGAGETPFKGTFEVSPLTKSAVEYCAIYGLNVNYTEGPAGLFGWIDGASIKNVTLVAPEICGKSYVAAVAGKIFPDGLVENCTVKGGIVYGNHYVAGVVAYAYGSVNNNTVDGTILTGESVNEDLDGDKVGGIVGLHAADADGETVKGNTVLNVTVVAKRDAAAVVGAANASNVTENHVEKATIGSTDAQISDAGVIVGRVLAGALNPKANTYNHETITVNGQEVKPAVVEFNAVAASEEVLPVEGGNYVINVTANVPWTVTVPEGLTASPAAGEGNATITVTVPATELTEPNPVTYQVTVATEEEAETKAFDFTIKQTAAEPPFKVATVAEFIAAAEDKTMYELTGVITSVTNTTYGNFYLKDATGEVLIYGLCSPEGEQKYWAASGAKVGDTITVQTVRSSYNGAAQGKNAIFVKLTPFVAQASEWGVVGDLTGWGNTKDIVMYTTWHTKNLFVAYNVEIKSGAFKVRANNQWNDAKNYGLDAAGSIYADKSYKVITGSGSQNATPMVYGKYDVYFDLTNKRVALMTPGKAYAEAVDGGKPVVVVAGLKNHKWGVVGSFAASNNWTKEVPMEVVGDWAVAKNVTLATNNEFKFRADGAWTLSYGSACDVNVGKEYITYNNGGNMKFVGEAGAYDIYFSLVTADFYMTEAAASTPLVVELSAATKPCADFPETSTGETVKKTYTIGEYEWTFAPSSGNKFSWYPTDKYILWGKSGGYILMPAVDGRKLTSVTILTGKNASTSVMVGVYNEAGTSAVNGGAAIKLAEKNAEFSWSLTDTEVNTPYQLRITSAHNAQLQKLVLVYE